ncbi:hypothetical protein IQ266_17385 [filamentous cyanobacterium LEGE 11480]|uniref:Uncharacterized protein n=1 Tax=Romeriopsis navalis LEGE 11480 TaxID=2777977 RepID=A0A928VPN0_9CYAN|nr:hypothetical protein [Romeriopsis navalis]MBE9031508.1 hypothetical protein [Romeriopsis navalis LEGE 11480]
MKARLFLIPAVLLLCVACRPKPNKVSDAANTGGNGQPSVKVDRRLGNFKAVPGTPFQMAPIVAAEWERSLLSKSNYPAGQTANYLFLDTETATFVKLLDDNRQLITNTSQFPTGPKACRPKTACAGQSETVKSIVYTIVKQDTNNDQRLTTDDSQTIAVSDANGKNYTELIQDADVVYHKVYKQATQRLLVAYARDGKRLLDVIDLTKKQVIETKPMVALGADVK